MSPNSSICIITPNNLIFASLLSLENHDSRHNLRIMYWELSIIQWSNIQMSEGTTFLDSFISKWKGEVNFYFYYSNLKYSKVRENNWLKLGLGDSL